MFRFLRRLGLKYGQKAWPGGGAGRVKPGAAEAGAERTVPQHIGIIMDGNGRWAQRRGLPRSAGHTAGAQTFRTIARYCGSIGVKFLTVYAFSTENWKRPQNEVNDLMALLEDYLEDFIRNFRGDNIRTRIIGDFSVLSPKLQELCREAEEVSAAATGLTLNIALNYGGRQEIVAAVRALCAEAAAGKLEPEEITEETFAAHLYTAGEPDPDLIIRPSGELRLSNFMLWQAAYAEYWATDVLWPDFTPETLEQALADFTKRGRRFGGV